MNFNTGRPTGRSQCGQLLEHEVGPLVADVQHHRDALLLAVAHRFAGELQGGQRTEDDVRARGPGGPGGRTAGRCGGGCGCGPGRCSGRSAGRAGRPDRRCRSGARRSSASNRCRLAKWSMVEVHQVTRWPRSASSWAVRPERHRRLPSGSVGTGSPTVMIQTRMLLLLPVDGRTGRSGPGRRSGAANSGAARLAPNGPLYQRQLRWGSGGGHGTGAATGSATLSKPAGLF